jgi:hypothetical protein
MNPENQQPSQPTEPQPTPVQPTPTSFNVPSPEQQPIQQPVAFPQPAATSSTPVTGMTPPTSANLQKQKKLAFILAIVSVVIFIIGLFFGYVFAAAAILGAYAVVIGVRTKAVPTIIIGALGLVLNFGLYTLSIFVK